MRADKMPVDLYGIGRLRTGCERHPAVQLGQSSLGLGQPGETGDNEGGEYVAERSGEPERVETGPLRTKIILFRIQFQAPYKSLVGNADSD